MRSKTSFLLTKFMTQKFKFSYSWVRVCVFGCCMWNINKKGTVSQENDDGTHCAVRTESRNGKYVPSSHWQFGKFLLCPYLSWNVMKVTSHFLDDGKSTSVPYIQHRCSQRQKSHKTDIPFYNLQQKLKYSLIFTVCTYCINVRLLLSFDIFIAI